MTLLNPFISFPQGGAASPIESLAAVAHTQYDATAQSSGLTDGDPVVSLTDQTGNSRTASQATSSKRAVKRTRGTGLVTWEFDGTDDEYKTSSFTGITNPLTVVALAKYDDIDTNQHRLFDGIASVGGLIIYTITNTWTMFSGALISDGADDGNWHVFVGVFNGASSSLYVDGGVAAATGNTGSEGLSGITVGASHAASTFWDGDQNFASFYNGNLYADNLALLNDVGAALSARASDAGLTIPAWTNIT